MTDAGRVGTVVLFCASEHAGNDLYIAHRDQKHDFAIPSNQTSFASCYGDAHCQIPTVTTGHLLFLVFDLKYRATIASNQDPYSWTLDGANMWAREFLDFWEESKDGELVYILKHRYNNANLCLDHLWGDDLA